MLRMILAIFLLTALTTQALAQTVYRWIDEQGRVHLSHAVPPEYRSLGFERLAPDGRVLETVPPELTPEERAAERQRRLLQAQLEAEQASQATRDRLLLATYRSEQDIIDTRNLRLDAMGQQRRALETSHRLAVQRFEDLVARAAELNRQAQPIAPGLQVSINESRTEIRRLRRALDDVDARMVEVSERFELELDRFRTLTQSAN